ncbi:hypothetical protein CBB_2577 [Clostridium botulinum Bf]|nr:hypothetical protein CBB_2577 [Clostridium botulinum Bf]
MKQKYITIILIAIVILNIFNGDFINPSLLDCMKFTLLIIALILNIILSRRK